MKKSILFALLVGVGLQAQSIKTEQLIDEIEPKVIEWRRDFHEHPELSSQRI